MKILSGAVICLVLAPSAVASVIDFEDFAPPGGLINVSPDAPYMEDGYTLTPSNANSAVFDSAASVFLIGDVSDWFGFAADNTITITNDAGVPFNLIDLLLGPSSIGVPPIDMTLVGHQDGGGTVSMTFTDLTTATTGVLNWTNLTSVEITTTSDAGLDNITLVVPAPAVLAFFGIAGLSAGRRRRRR